MYHFMHDISKIIIVVCSIQFTRIKTTWHAVSYNKSTMVEAKQTVITFKILCSLNYKTI